MTKTKGSELSIGHKYSFIYQIYCHVISPRSIAGRHLSNLFGRSFDDIDAVVTQRDVQFVVDGIDGEAPRSELARLKDSKRIPEPERATDLIPEFLQSVSSLDPASYLPRWKGELRIQQAMDDIVTPSTARDKIAAAAPKHDDVFRYQDKMAQIKSWGTSSFSGWLGEQLTSH